MARTRSGHSATAAPIRSQRSGFALAVSVRDRAHCENASESPFFVRSVKTRSMNARRYSSLPDCLLPRSAVQAIGASATGSGDEYNVRFAVGPHRQLPSVAQAAAARALRRRTRIPIARIAVVARRTSDRLGDRGNGRRGTPTDHDGDQWCSTTRRTGGIWLGAEFATHRNRMLLAFIGSFSTCGYRDICMTCSIAQPTSKMFAL